MNGTKKQLIIYYLQLRTLDEASQLMLIKLSLKLIFNILIEQRQ